MSEDVHLIHFESREDWLANRLSGIGASESPALFGLSPWHSELSLWTEKRGLAQRNDEMREWQEIGLLVEPAAAELYRRRTSRTLWAPKTSWAMARHRDVGCMTASIDQWVVEAEGKDGRGVLELKNVGFGRAEEWADGPPTRVVVQVQHQLAVTGFRWGSAAGILGGNRFVTVDIERNDEFIEELEYLCRQFWARVEEGRMPSPDGSAATARALKRLYPRDNGAAVVLDHEAEALWNELAALRAGAAQMKKREQELKNLLGASIGEATFGLLPDGRLLSYRQQQRSGYMVAPTEFRVLKEEDKPTSPEAFVDEINKHAKEQRS